MKGKTVYGVFNVLTLTSFLLLSVKLIYEIKIVTTEAWMRGKTGLKLYRKWFKVHGYSVRS